ncbi:MAG: peptide deformylase, partial [Dehalococcoidia bacterium]
REGCLSLPGIQKEIKRPKVVKAVGLDLDGRSISVKGPDLLAAVLCHEIDHLDGILITDKGAT